MYTVLVENWILHGEVKADIWLAVSYSATND